MLQISNPIQTLFFILLALPVHQAVADSVFFLGETPFERSGRVVSAAGDINGDGFDDVMIGTFQTRKTYVVYGSQTIGSIGLNSLDGTNGFLIFLDQGSSQNGFSSIAALGDVNADGINDVAIGFVDAMVGGFDNVGSIYVVYGNDEGFSPVFNLSGLDGKNGFVINGENENDFLGASLAAIGDINDDGVDDFVVGAYGFDPNGVENAGRSHVIYGDSKGFPLELDLSTLDGTNGFYINGVNENDFSGFSAASAGDVNGDGISDLIIGALNADPNGLKNAGSAYVLFGSKTGFSKEVFLSTLDGQNGFAIYGQNVGDLLGRSVSSAGDFNADGFGDIVIGAFSADPNGIEAAGSTYVIFGKASGFSAVLEASSLDGTSGFVINGEQESDFSGISVASAGDFNADGFSDLLLGAPGFDVAGIGIQGFNAGRGYLVLGKGTMNTAVFELSELCETCGFTLTGFSQEGNLGESVAVVGDFNGDTISDIIVGSGGHNRIIGPKEQTLNSGLSWLERGIEKPLFKNGFERTEE